MSIAAMIIIRLTQKHRGPDGHPRTWDPCALQWLDTPLAKWARCAQQHTCAEEGDCGDEADRAVQATVWDNIDTIPPEDEPVFFTD